MPLLVYILPAIANRYDQIFSIAQLFDFGFIRFHDTPYSRTHYFNIEAAMNHDYCEYIHKI